MRTLLSLTSSLLAGVTLTFSPVAFAADEETTATPQPGTERPAAPLPPAKRPATKDPRVISAPLHDAASTGASSDPDAPPAGETDAERARRVLEKFRQRPGYQEDPPDPQA